VRNFTALVCESITRNNKKLQIVTKNYNFLGKSNKMLQGKLQKVIKNNKKLQNFCKK